MRVLLEEAAGAVADHNNNNNNKKKKSTNNSINSVNTNNINCDSNNNKYTTNDKVSLPGLLLLGYDYWLIDRLSIGDYCYNNPVHPNDLKVLLGEVAGDVAKKEQIH